MKKVVLLLSVFALVSCGESAEEKAKREKEEYIKEQSRLIQEELKREMDSLDRELEELHENTAKTVDSLNHEIRKEYAKDGIYLTRDEVEVLH